jgi:glycosyltransferase involved in cell wall biosynthesis
MQISFVLGTKNRRNLLAATLDSIRRASEEISYEIIVIDGGSTDGSCDWLATQFDVITIIQPNKYVVRKGLLRRLHTWGAFMNLGFREARGKWIVMVSDDLLLCPDSIKRGLKVLEESQSNGLKVGGGALFWRDYPRRKAYHVKRLYGGVVHLNHGFLLKSALDYVGYIDEDAYEFYGADGDLSMRLHLANYPIVPLPGCLAEHLNHRLKRFGPWSKVPTSGDRDMETFVKKYSAYGHSLGDLTDPSVDSSKTANRFWRLAPATCLQGAFAGLLEKYLINGNKPR